MRNILIGQIILFLLVLGTHPAASSPITFADMISLGRVQDPQVSPDGRSIAYVVSYESKSEGRTTSNIWLVSSSGDRARQFTTSAKRDTNPRWSPDGRSIAFISDRDGESQIWLIPADGGEARKLTSISTEASGVLFSPDGKFLAFASSVYPDCQTDEANKKRIEEKKKSNLKAEVLESLPYRVWDHWREGKRSHLFVVPAAGGSPRDITPGGYDTPPIDLGGSMDYAFSPDGQEICFVCNTDPDLALSTNNDLFVVPTFGGKAKRITINVACDNQPVYSPKGKYIAYRAQMTPGFESDRYRLTLYERSTGNIVNLTEEFDRSVEEVVWAPDETAIYFTAEEAGYMPIFKFDMKTRQARTVIGGIYAKGLRITPDGRRLIFTNQSFTQPAEIFCADSDGGNLRQITRTNASTISKLDLGPVREFWFEGAGKTRVHGFLILPPGFRAEGKYPLLMLIHGGPQQSWSNEWHYRWNAQLFASPGYAVAMINPRGSVGYGHIFTREISGDWGGKVYEDLMLGLDHLLATYPFLDKNRVAAAGASFGGYMVNWIQGHTARFRCLVTHAGVYNLISMYGSTEELWFPEWEFRGNPWNAREQYEKWSPHNYVQKFKTPHLITHGELDFRVPLTQAMELFTALQRQKIPSRFLYFPDEGHLILKPQNAELWYRTVLNWLGVYLKK